MTRHLTLVNAIAFALTAATVGCNATDDVIEIEQPGYELSPIQLQPGFQRCATTEPNETSRRLTRPQ